MFEMSDTDFYFIRTVQGLVKMVPRSYVPKQGETIVLDEVVVGPKKLSAGQEVVKFVKKHRTPIAIGIVAYFIIKKVTGVDILP
jgi:hypothetical protein